MVFKLLKRCFEVVWGYNIVICSHLGNWKIAGSVG